MHYAYCFSWFPGRLLVSLGVSVVSCLVLITSLMAYPASCYLGLVGLASLGLFALASGLQLATLIGRPPATWAS